MTGAPASGKSTTAVALGREIGAAVLDQDSMTNPLVDVIMKSMGTSDYADPRVATLTRDARYECLLQVASDCLRGGVSVILIAPFTAERADAEAWERLESRLGDAGGQVHLVWIRLEPGLLIERLVARGATRDADKVADPDGYLASVDLNPPSVRHIEVDGADNPQDQVTSIAAALTRSTR